VGDVVQRGDLEEQDVVTAGGRVDDEAGNADQEVDQADRAREATSCDCHDSQPFPTLDEGMDASAAPAAARSWSPRTSAAGAGT
jgi:hypothetical protein